MPGSRTRGSLLSELQTAFGMRRENEDISPCGRILKKLAIDAGRRSTRTRLSRLLSYSHRDWALDDSCVLQLPRFHASDQAEHSVLFYLTQQVGRCCDCGDPKPWRRPIQRRFHPQPYIVKTNGIINRILCMMEAFFTNPDSNPFKSERFIQRISVIASTEIVGNHGVDIAAPTDDMMVSMWWSGVQTMTCWDMVPLIPPGSYSRWQVFSPYPAG
jgi:hypothetical protein